MSGGLRPAAAAPLLVTGLLAGVVAFPGAGQAAGRCDPALSLRAPSSASAGQTVRLALVARNRFVRPCVLHLGGRPPHDFVVVRRGRTVWTWRHGRAVRDVLDLRTLAPGEAVEFAGEWDQKDLEGNPVPPGTYFVYGVLYLEPPEFRRTRPARLVVRP
ncbi:MAG: BsuPI-related putative proteinase inhibitor [Armatimonadota bacterium]|nr:BsuPI-related putative proteinase inhibitor [Armatimonadota bacterium]MDR7614750.1 BsuPI-related putative proteinase inhibitor [Armatimonadota bacterium]